MKQALSVHAGECFAQTWSGEAPHCWSYDYIIDTRSPAEYRLDRLPGAVNWPVLDDRQRETIGTMYQREGAFKAKREGAILVARNIASLIERHARSIDKEARLLIYCWRGGNRSGSLSTVLSRIGFRCDVLDGGYKAFRRWVMEDSARRVSQLHFQIIAGRTGSGKTDLLHHLAAQGAQVIDLEGLESIVVRCSAHNPSRFSRASACSKPNYGSDLGNVNPIRPYGWSLKVGRSDKSRFPNQ